MGPIFTQRKRFKFYLDPVVVRAFRMLCKQRGLRANRVIEAFMIYCLDSPVLIKLISRKYPELFHKPTRKERRAKQIRNLIDEASKLLEDLELGE